MAHCNGSWSRLAGVTQGKLQDMVLVDQRPPEVESRLFPGHFEGDLILGAGNRSAVGVLVERTSRYTFLCHLPQKDATSVREAFTRKLKGLPAALRKSLTYDQGKEMAEHKRLAANLDLQVFFCHPHSPWERVLLDSRMREPERPHPPLPTQRHRPRPDLLSATRRNTTLSRPAPSRPSWARWPFR